MADERPQSKPFKSSRPAPKPAVDVEAETVDIILVLFIVGAIASVALPLIAQMLMGITFLDAIKNFFITIYTYYRFFATFVSVLLATGIIYCTIRLNQIRTEEGKIYNTPRDKNSLETPDAEVKKHRNQKWVRIEELIDSQNSSDWRLAIIEADILLDEMLSRMPYPGETIADRLKLIERSDFTTIENAWEAHKARNQIVHAGSEFQLTERESKRIINLYRTVFEEFYFI